MPPTNRKIKILQIIKGLDIGALNGGSERFGLSLACALDPARYEVEVCIFFEMNTPAAEMWQRRLEEAGIPYFFASDWHGNDRFDIYLKGIQSLRNRLRSQSVDVVNSHFQLGHLAALDLKARGMTKKAVRTVQNMPAREWSPGWYGWARYQLFTKWIFPVRMDAEVGVSQAVVDELNRHAGARLFKRHACLIYNAISILPVEILPPLGNDTNAVLGVIGRLAEQKGHRYLLEAVRLIKPVMPGLQVWLIGDGELRAELETLSARLGLVDCIQFLGRREDVPVLMGQMNLLVLPSIYEGLPINVLEGMAAGLPVIATDIPGTREVVRHGETGWLVPPRDPQALADRILQVLGDPDSTERVRRSALQQLNRYSIRSAAEQYAKLYSTLLG